MYFDEEGVPWEGGSTTSPSIHPSIHLSIDPSPVGARKKGYHIVESTFFSGRRKASHPFILFGLSPVVGRGSICLLSTHGGVVVCVVFYRRIPSPPRHDRLLIFPRGGMLVDNERTNTNKPRVGLRWSWWYSVCIVVWYVEGLKQKCCSETLQEQKKLHPSAELSTGGGMMIV